MHEQKISEILVKNISSNSDRHLSLNQHNHPSEQKDSVSPNPREPKISKQNCGSDLRSQRTHHVRPQV
jgi:hypothetical protein